MARKSRTDKEKELPLRGRRTPMMRPKNGGHDSRTDALFADYLKHLQRSGHVKATLDGRRSCFKVFTRWCGENGVDDQRHAQQADLEAFIVWLANEHQPRGRTLSPLTVRDYVGFLRSLYGWMLAERHVLSNPAKNLRRPKRPKRIHRDILSAPECKRLLSALDESTPQEMRDGSVIRLLAFSGVRASELCHLNLDEVNLKDRELIIRQGKPKKDRLGFFDIRTRQHLATYLVKARPRLAAKQEPAFFVDDKGQRMRPKQLRVIIRTYTKKARLRKHLTCHSLRRTLCTLLLQNGCNLKVVAEVAGHESVATSAGYTKVDISELASVYRQTHPRYQ